MPCLNLTSGSALAVLTLLGLTEPSICEDAGNGRYVATFKVTRLTGEKVSGRYYPDASYAITIELPDKFEVVVRGSGSRCEVAHNPMESAPIPSLIICPTEALAEEYFEKRIGELFDLPSSDVASKSKLDLLNARVKELEGTLRDFRKMLLERLNQLPVELARDEAAIELLKSRLRN
jgi:hypothetical protein